MATVQEHYGQLLAGVYAWMFGGFDSALETNTAFFQKHSIRPQHGAMAIDLGAGCGFQSIPLAQAGFSVTAIDLDEALLAELKSHAGALPIRTVQDDLLQFERHVTDKAELIVCMTDTLLHLDSRDKIRELFKKVSARLEEGGRFVLTFRDLTFELEGLDRFIPVKSDATAILTCFLEYEPQTVKVHDILYRMDETGDWRLSKSFYRKLRLSQGWAGEQLAEAGLTVVHSNTERGVVTLIAQK